MTKASHIQVQSLSSAYADKSLFLGFDFDFQLGHLYGIVGNNGSGKSTLLKHLAGIHLHFKGKISYDDLSIHTLSAKEKAAFRFYIHGGSFSDKDITVLAALELAYNGQSHLFGLVSANESKRLIEESKRFGIQELIHQKLSHISDGEFQKVMLCMALVSQSPFILLDEPTAYLDFKSKNKTFELLKQICTEHQKCIIVATHDIYQLIQHTDQVLHIDQQRIELKSKEAILHYIQSA
jgi:iron complex transport system ATP-binding protein